MTEKKGIAPDPITGQSDSRSLDPRTPDPQERDQGKLLAAIHSQLRTIARNPANPGDVAFCAEQALNAMDALKHIRSLQSPAPAPVDEARWRFEFVDKNGKQWKLVPDFAGEVTDADKAAAIGALTVDEAPDWQPIESAPKDGTKIDLWADGQRFTNCRWGKHDAESIVPWGEEHWRGYPLKGIAPTHWLPLPPAPPEAEQPKKPKSSALAMAFVKRWLPPETSEADLVAAALDLDDRITPERA